MKTLFLTLIVASCGGWLGPWAVPAYADTLSGQVQASDGTPIAGLTMYLAHPTVGRSSAILTDSSGRFRFLNVPHIAEAYYLEIYWGLDLIYRVQEYISNDTVLAQPIVLGR